MVSGKASVRTEGKGQLGQGRLDEILQFFCSELSKMRSHSRAPVSDTSRAKSELARVLYGSVIQHIQNRLTMFVQTKLSIFPGKPPTFSASLSSDSVVLRTFYSLKPVAVNTLPGRPPSVSFSVIPITPTLSQHIHEPPPIVFPLPTRAPGTVVAMNYVKMCLCCGLSL